MGESGLRMEPVRIAVVGVGRMGAFHARTLAGLESVRVAAVADVDATTAHTIGEQIGARHYGSTADLRQDREVEAWLVATSTLSHPDIVRQALENDIHVLCEKPLALDPAESEALGALAVEAERVLQVGFWRRFSPPWAEAKRLLDAGAIGRPLLLRLAQWDADPPPASFCDPATSGGLAIDCGVHEFDLVEWLTGLPVETVTARNLPIVDPSIGAVGDVDNLLAVLDLAEGAVATVDLSRNCRYGDDVRTEILGEQGAIFVDLLPSGRTRLATAAAVEVVAESQSDDAFAAGIAAQAESFAAAVRGQSVEVPGARASSRAVTLGLATQRAAETGAVVGVDA